jgi:DNA-binding NarL/FixJ family response regulator
MQITSEPHVHSQRESLGSVTEMGKTRVLVVDDHPIMQLGLSELINAEPDLEVCATAGDVTEALQKIESTQPEVAIVDISLKGGSGIELLEQIKSRHHEVKVLVSSMYDESLFAERALRAGAMGFINKQETTDKVIAALRQILGGQIYVSPRMANRLLRTVVGGAASTADPIVGLSTRELEVFELIGQGMTTKQVARKLHLSPKTIETHREKIKSKLNLKNSAELSCRAVQWVLERR